jgi:hypothetical protein
LTRKVRESYLDECIRWFYENVPESLPDGEKIEQVTLFAMARFLLSEKTAREYAKTVVARSKLNLPESALTTYEIMRKRQKIDEVIKQEREQLQLNQQERELRSKWLT